MNDPAPHSPWSLIWFNPRAAVRLVLSMQPQRSLRLLAAGGGIGQAFSFAAGMGIGQSLGVRELALFIFLLGPTAGFVSLFLWSALLSWAARLFGGTADRDTMRVAVAWSWAPAVYLLPMWGVRYILFRDELFTDARPFVDSHALLSALFSFFNGVDFFLSFFTLYVLIQTVSELGHMSVWKSIGAIFIVIMTMTLPAMLLFTALSKM